MGPEAPNTEIIIGTRASGRPQDQLLEHVVFIVGSMSGSILGIALDVCWVSLLALMLEAIVSDCGTRLGYFWDAEIALGLETFVFRLSESFIFEVWRDATELKIAICLIILCGRALGAFAHRWFVNGGYILALSLVIVW